MRIRTWHRHPRADVALTTWGSVTVTVSDGVRSYSSQHGTLNPFAHAVLTGFPAKNGVCAIRFRETGSIIASNTALVDGRKTGEYAFDVTSAGTPQFWSPYFSPGVGTTLTPLALGIFTPDDWRIMQMLGLNLFDALTAPYAAVPDGGGVFLLALIVLIGGWRHENTESMAGPALRKQGRHLECDTGIRHHSEERRLLGIHPSQVLSLHPASAGRMHDDAAQPAQLMELHTAGAGGFAAHGEWGSRHGHHQRRNKEYYWHPCACRHQDHSDGHVRRRSGRMADPAGGRSARLRSRHRTLLNVPGVAA